VQSVGSARRSNSADCSTKDQLQSPRSNPAELDFPTLGIERRVATSLECGKTLRSLLLD
jgi:hypothetical protein